MTEEQIEDFFLQYQHLHPDQVKSATVEDNEFEEFEKELAEECTGVIYETTQIVPYGEEASVFVTEAPPDEWEDV